MDKKNIAYVDGSFNPITKEYCGGAILFDQNGKQTYMYQTGSDPDMAKMRNVAGELTGVIMAIMKALSFGMETLTICYDYMGIECWATSKWKTKNKYTKRYKDFINYAIGQGLNLHFSHIKAHSGDPLNEEIDKIVRRAIQ